MQRAKNSLLCVVGEGVVPQRGRGRGKETIGAQREGQPQRGKEGRWSKERGRAGELESWSLKGW